MLYLARLLPLNLGASYHWYLAFNLLCLLSLGFIYFDRKVSPMLQGAVLLFLVFSLSLPIFHTLSFGQINLILAVIMLWGYYFWQRDKKSSVWIACLLFSICFWLKLVPAVLVGVLAFQNPKRLFPLLLIGLGTGLALLAVDAKVFLQWLDFLANDQQKIIQFPIAWLYESYGVDMFIKSLFVNPIWQQPLVAFAKGIVVSLLVAGLWLVLKAPKISRWYQFALPLALGLFLLSPVTWSHHLVFYAPPALLAMLITFDSWKNSVWAYILVVSVALWLVCPRYALNTKTYVEVFAYRINTILALWIMVVFVVGQFFANKKELA
jgi:hypothetical protein